MKRARSLVREILISSADLPGPSAVLQISDYLLTGHRLSMGFAASAVISIAAQ
jgi:hypothetical protein